MLKKITLIGEILVDLIADKDMTIKPFPGGSLFNTASTLSKFGAKTLYYSNIGDDYWGNYLLNEMKSMSLDTSCIVKSNSTKTPLAFAVIDKNGNALYDFYKSKFTSNFDLTKFQDTGILHYGSSFSIYPDNEKTINLFINKAIEEGSIISYDPNFRISNLNYKENVFKNFLNANIIKASFEDLQNLYQISSLNEAFSFLSKFPQKLTIITLGKDGSAACLNNGEIIKINSSNIKVADTIGAGDSFSAGYIYYLYIKNILNINKLSEISNDLILNLLKFAALTSEENLKVKGAVIPEKRLVYIKKSII